jgi:purine-binding chemotaxis protein CheW
MDLAKIRKKLKEAKKKGTGDSQQETKDVTPPEPVSVSPEISPVRLIIEKDITEEVPEVEEFLEETPEEESSAEQEKTEAEESLDKGKASAEEKAPSGGEPEGGGEGALQSEDGEVVENILEFLHFRLANEDYAFKVSEIEEILKFHSVTRVPRMEDYIMGLSSLRGKIIPLIDLKKRLGISGERAVDAKGREQNRIIIVNGPKGSIGAYVDLVVDVLRVPEEMLQEAPPHLSESEARFVEGIALWEGKFISIIRTNEALNITLAQSLSQTQSGPEDRHIQ